MAKTLERQKLIFVVNALRAAGYDPYAQLMGYVSTGNAAYITRQGGARTMVRGLDARVILEYLTQQGHKRSA